MERLRFEGLNWDGHYDKDFNWVEHRWNFRELLERPWFSGGHGGDEYGNCTLYFRCPLFGIIWWYPTGHYQTRVELPDLGDCEWVDVVLFGEEPAAVPGQTAMDSRPAKNR
jgi:hypothetical protein